VSRSKTFNPRDIFAALCQQKVDFVVIGGLAAVAGGVPWTTFDADIVIENSEDNLTALARALEQLEAEYDTPHLPPIKPDTKRLRTLNGPQLFRTSAGRLDVLKEAGGETFGSVAQDAHTTNFEGLSIRYASIPALLRMKRAANRPKDREEIPLLEEALAKGR
jgi:hypothetical protein